MSKAIIRPSTTPSTMPAPPSAIAVRPSFSAVMSAPSGLPSTTTMMKPLTSVARSGMTSTGIRPRAQVGTRQPAIQAATTPARTPPTMPPRNPLWGVPKPPRSMARAPMTNPGAMPGRSAMA